MNVEPYGWLMISSAIGIVIGGLFTLVITNLFSRKSNEIFYLPIGQNAWTENASGKILGAELGEPPRAYFVLTKSGNVERVVDTKMSLVNKTDV